MGLLNIFAEFISIIIGFLAFRKKSISRSGLIALVIISSLFNFLGHTPLLCIQFYMFASSSFLTNLKASQKKAFEKIVAKTGPRDFRQAIANLGVATVCMLFYHFTGLPIFLAALLGSVAAANADSWASEIGGLSKCSPVMITTFRKVEKGVSGGITLLGTLGGVAGSIFIVLMTALTWKVFGTVIQPNLLLAAFIAGVIGLIVDSILGAAFQALYANRISREVTEREAQENQLIKGFRYINNDVVNLMTTIFAAIVAGILYKIFPE